VQCPEALQAQITIKWSISIHSVH